MSPPTKSDPGPTNGAGRRGRPVAGTQEERRDRVLDAALAQLVDSGAEQLTMAGVARRAAASKETLYRWFGDREGLLAALIIRNADRSAHRIEQRLNITDRLLTARDFRVALVDYAAGLLGLLTGDASVALNRAAMIDPTLRLLLLEHGRHRVGPIVERFLDRGERAGLVSIGDVGGAAGAFELLYGLVVRDTQIRVLLGERPPTTDEIARRADEAIAQFVDLVAPEGSEDRRIRSGPAGPRSSAG